MHFEMSSVDAEITNKDGEFWKGFENWDESVGDLDEGEGIGENKREAAERIYLGDTIVKREE